MVEADNSNSAERVLNAARLGDANALRDSIARYVLEHEDLIRALVRRKLTNRARQENDTDDVLASVLRRVDLFVSRGKYHLDSEDDVMNVIVAIVRNTTVTKVRLAEQAKRLLAEDGRYLQVLHRRAKECGTDSEAALLLNQLMFSLDDSTQRQYLGLRIRGASHRAIAQALGLSTDAARKRWGVITHRLRAVLADPEGHHGQHQ